MGTGVFALGARDIAKLVATPSPANFARFAFSPIYTIANAGASLVRGANFARHAVMLGGIRGLAPFMRIGAVAGITIAAGIGYLLYENLLKEETKKEMQKA